MKNRARKNNNNNKQKGRRGSEREKGGQASRVN